MQPSLNRSFAASRTYLEIDRTTHIPRCLCTSMESGASTLAIQIFTALPS